MDTQSRAILEKLHAAHMDRERAATEADRIDVVGLVANITAHALALIYIALHLAGAVR